MSEESEELSEKDRSYWAEYGDEKPPEAHRAGAMLAVDKVMRQYFIGRRFYAKFNIYDLTDFLGIILDVIKLLGELPNKWLPLNEIVNRLEPGSRFGFWREVLECREFLPPEELLKVWYDCANDRGRIDFQRVTTNDGCEYYDAKLGDPEEQAASVITNPLLIDDPIVSFRYSQVKKPGWRLLRYIRGRSHRNKSIPEPVLQAIHKDHLPLFCIHKDIQGTRISYALLAEVVEHNALTIFRYLVENNLITDRVIPLDELCCYLTAQCKDTISVPMLTALEEFHPGVIQGVKDVFGRNLLWFAVQNKMTGWFHPDCKLTPFLLKHGCDPQNTNQLGLPWQFVTNGLSLQQKVNMMQNRYTVDSRSKSAGFPLSQRQPLDRLTA